MNNSNHPSSEIKSLDVDLDVGVDLDLDLVYWAA